MDDFDTQIQCEEVYGDEGCAQFMLEQLEQMELEDLNSELDCIYNNQFDWTTFKENHGH